MFIDNLAISLIALKHTFLLDIIIKRCILKVTEVELCNSSTDELDIWVTQKKTSTKLWRSKESFSYPIKLSLFRLGKRGLAKLINSISSNKKTPNIDEYDVVR